MIRVELAPEVTASLRAMKDRGMPPPRCHKGVLESAIAGGVRRLIEGSLAGFEEVAAGARAAGLELREITARTLMLGFSQ